jgi:hypothetical protein
MGKPFGFGKVQIKINNASLTKNSDMIANKKRAFNPYDESKLKEFMNDFIKEIKDNLNIDWEASDQIKYLKAMANPVNAKKNNLQYMILDPDKRINEFADGKKEKIILKPYKL